MQRFRIVITLTQPLPGALARLSPGPVDEPGARQLSFDFRFAGPIEHRGNRAKTESVGRPAQVCLQNLADVHAPGNTERVQDDVDRRAILQKRHVFFRDHSGNDALVAVSPGHFVPLGQLAALCHRDAHHFIDARFKVAVFITSEDAHADHFAFLAMRKP